MVIVLWVTSQSPVVGKELEDLLAGFFFEVLGEDFDKLEAFGLESQPNVNSLTIDHGD